MFSIYCFYQPQTVWLERYMEGSGRLNLVEPVA